MSLNRDSVQTKFSSVNTELTESLIQRNINIDSVINKWITIQKILKEGQNLEKIIEKQHLDAFGQIKKNIHDFYKLKIKSRKIYEDIKFLKFGSDWIFADKDEENDNFFIAESSGSYFGNAFEKIRNILSIIRENYY